MKRSLKLISILLALVLTVSIIPVSSVGALEPTLDMSMTLHQEGNQLFNEKGQAVRLLGINVPHYGWSLVGDNAVDRAIDLAINDWQSNFIRLAVKPAFWLGLGSTSADEAEKYRQRIDAAIAKISAAGKYVLLDNHSFYLPGEDSELFWADAAKRYKDHPNVVFGLFNEPAVCSWRQYFEGQENYSYQGENAWGQQDTIVLDSKGVPNLLRIVRATGAKNVVTLSGLTWGFDLEYVTPTRFRGFAENRAAELIDSGKLTEANKAAWIEEYIEKYGIYETTGNGIMFETHPYPEREDDWDTYLFDAAMEYPIVVGECGPTELRNGATRVLSATEKSYLDKLTSWMDKYGIHLTAWAMGAWPHLTQVGNIAKPSAYGEVIMEFIARNNASKAVQFYTGIDYKGTKAVLEPGKYEASELAGFDMANLASVSAKDDYYQYVVTFYEKAGQKGKSYTIIPNVSDINPKKIGFKPASLLIERQIRKNILPGHATVTANNTAGGNETNLVVDGKVSSYWTAQFSGYAELILELDQVYALNGITLCHAGEAGMLSSDNNRSYVVSLSTNGVLYNRVVDVQNNGLGLTSYFFDQTPAKYIRVQVRKGGLIEPNVVYLAEVQAYGSPYSGQVENLPGKIPGTDGGATTIPSVAPVTTTTGSVASSTDAATTTTTDTGTSATDATQPTTGAIIPERTYYQDSEGNIYYIDEATNEKVLVDQTGKEIGRVPREDNDKDTVVPKPVDDGMPAYVWILIAGGAVLVIAAVVIILVVSKKKKN